jgi:uncharacterized membrane protein HdeD (DUF308 family)
VAVASGIAILVWPQETTSLIVLVLGSYLLANGLLRIYAGMRTQSEDERARPMTLLRGGIGLVVGLVVIIQPLSQYIDLASAVTILAIGLLLIGVIGLLSAFREGSRWWGVIISSGLQILLGTLLLLSRGNPSVVQWLGVTTLVFGGLLVAYGLILYRSAGPSAEAGRETTLGNS